MNDYQRFRGHCKELSEAAVKADPTLTLVRGYYHCPMWGKQQHWWTTRPDGSVYDPSANQFPSKGWGVYEPFNGIVHCANCDKRMKEEEAWRLEGRYAYCSHTCYGQFVGVL